MKESKTARASAVKMPPKEKSVIPDDELIRLLRIERASGIWPSSQGVDALLRAYDAEQAEKSSVLATLNKHLVGRTYTELDDAVRNLLQAYVVMKDNFEEDEKALVEAKRQHEEDQSAITAMESEGGFFHPDAVSHLVSQTVTVTAGTIPGL